MSQQTDEKNLMRRTAEFATKFIVSPRMMQKDESTPKLPVFAMAAPHSKASDSEFSCVPPSTILRQKEERESKQLASQKGPKR